MKRTLKIGIRALVAYVLRGGDLTLDYFSQSRAIDGIRAHQNVQKDRPAGYLSEVGISFCYENTDFCMELSGRIDGIMRKDKSVVVEEIKTSALDRKQLADKQNPVHWGQLKAYAYIYAVKHGLGQIVGQLTYVHPVTMRQIKFREVYTLAALEHFFTVLVQSYLKWAEYQLAWEACKVQSIQSLKFPYEIYRRGQRQMAVAVYRTIRSRGKILIQAPTGIGKTMATIFPAIKSMDDQMLGKLFYLTARTTGRVAAENVFDLLRLAGLRFKVVTLTAKEKICFCPRKSCHPEECRFAKGYYDRLNDAIWSALEHDQLDRTQIEKVAQAFTICPFEFSLDISQWADGIVCDYNYVFDPRVFLRRYFAEVTDTHILLVDEAHNLVDRSREMFSAQITKQTLLELRRTVKGKLKRVYKVLTRMNNWFLTAAKKAPESAPQWSDDELPGDLLSLLTQFVEKTEKWLRLNIRSSYRDAIMEHYFAAVGFLRVAEEFDHSYAVCYTKSAHDLMVKLFCIDPSRQMAQAVNRGGAAVFFSATLTPMEYFQYLFGCNQQVKTLALPSPFPVMNLAVFRADYISTYYRNRENTKAPLCYLLSVFTDMKRGNYMLFFSSYAYLEMIHGLFVAARPDVDVIAQTPDMTEAERNEFLNRFQKENSRTLVGFVVLGGIFGEGIDLVGDRLCGAAVIGVGLPGIGLERELIRKYYQEQNQCGFEFAYQFPGINRVLQAAGRVIRTETDRGAVLLVDSRFNRRHYLNLLPDHWYPVRVLNPDRLRFFLERFWLE